MKDSSETQLTDERMMKYVIPPYRKVRTFPVPRPHFDTAKKRTYEIIKQFKPNNILDVGCGIGKDYVALSMICKEYVGVDPIKGNIKIAKKRNPDGDFRVAFMQELPFHNDSFDVIYMSGVWENLPDEYNMKQGIDIWWDDIVPNQSDFCKTEQMNSEDYAMIIFSSGTTGRPKGTVHTHGGALAQIVKELGYYFDIKENDVFFWLTDIGWMMGPWMIIGVQSFGATITIYEGAPNYPEPDRLWKLIDKHKITILGISPTAIRMFMRYGDDWVDKHDLSSLRILGSTGEPWDPDSWNWFFEKVGKRKIPIINISGGTEIVGCFLSPLPITELKPCTLRGPGLAMDIDVFDEDGKPIRRQMGHLVAKKPAPSMTRGFWNEPERYIDTYWSKWPNIWYHGDWASIDENGFWFLHGRSDDTIKIAGRRTGPAEIEAALIEHPGVSEAATIGVPDEIKGEDMVCFVVLKTGFKPSENLREELKNQVVKIMGKTLKPRDLRFVNDLPKTRSAKIVRRIIKASYLKDEISDISSIENPQAIDAIRKSK